MSKVSVVLCSNDNGRRNGRSKEEVGGYFLYEVIFLRNTYTGLSFV